jgi:hypothetical protein
MPYYLITKHLAEPSSLPLNAYVFNKIGLKDARLLPKAVIASQGQLKQMAMQAA